MRRKKCRTTLSFRNVKLNDATATLWTCIVYLFFIAICACNDAIVTSTMQIQTTNGGHHVSNTPVYSSRYRNHSKDVIELPNFNRIANTNYTQHLNSQRKYTFIRSGNELWDGLIDDCLHKPTFSCFQKNVYTYLDNTLKLDDVNVTDRILFKKIDIDVNTLYQLQNDTDEDNEIRDEEGRDMGSESPIEEVTDALYGKWRSFMMTHNLEVKMPDMLFDGATFRLTPRAFEGDGALVKLELIPKALEVEERSTGRFLFKKLSKFLLKKFFKNKLLLSFLAIVLVIKLIKIKIFWILPLIVGVTAAKKLLLKFILFLFPALSHLFKLCSYYHKNYHETKYHHHRHQINHLHTVVPQWYKDYQEHHGHVGGGHGPELIYTSPPKGHPAEYIHGINPHQHQHYPSNWEHSGPGLGSEYISDIHRNINVNSYKPKLDDVDTISSWGLSPDQAKQHDNSVNEYINDAEPSASAYPSPPIENSIGRTPLKESRPLHSSHYHSYDPSSQMKYTDKYVIAEKIQNAIRQQPAYAPTQSLIVADPFYGPIVAKIDSILMQYSGFLDDNCKEWLVCNMYKNPVKYSPHSNFLSAELSRDSSELQKPATLNMAVLIFYKYVKAARDGQDQKDCLSLNPKCVVV